MYTLTLSGSPRARGRAHGEELREAIATHYDLWRQFISSETGLSPEDYFQKLYTFTDFMPAIERYTPDLLEEVRGIAEGSGQPFDHVLARQLSDEEPWFRQIIRFGRPIPEHCSALAAAGVDGAPNIVAQNMDTPGYYRNAVTVLRIQEPDSDIEALVFTVAGKISLAGMNNRGVAIACNSVLQLDFDITGLPEDFVVRKTLQQGSLADVLWFMKHIPHASGQNYVLGDPTDITDLEVSARHVTVFEPLSAPKRIYHTNHPMVNQDTTSWDRLLEQGQETDPETTAFILSRMTTHHRCAAVQGQVEGAAAIDVAGARAILSQHEGGVCVHYEGDDLPYTLGCLVMELDAENPRFHVAPGPGCETPFTIFDLS